MTVKNRSIDQGSQIAQHSAFGHKLRFWRNQKRMSQLELAVGAELSPRHLSFIETGRSRPKRDVVLRLAETLDIPLRERLNMGNDILETTTMIARFGPVNDVFLSELRVEMIFPANESARLFFSRLG